MNALRQALQVFGIKRQLRKLAEECSELAIAALHLEDLANAANQEQLFEELADVEIMIQQMRLYYGDTGVDAFRARKIARLEKTIGSMRTSPEPAPPPPAKPKPVPASVLPDDPLLSVKEAAQRIGITPNGLYCAIHAKRIDVVQDGPHKTRIRESVALAYRDRTRAREAAST